MITKNQLLDALSGKIAASQVQEVRRDIFRAELRHAGNPYAVHYFDLTRAFLEESFDVASYQTEIIASDYYNHPGDLQWNYYYDFVVDDAEASQKGVQEAKRVVERDLVFSRKSVTAISEIRRYFAPISLAKGGVPEDFKTIWADTLEGHGLSSVLDLSQSMDGVVEAFMSRNPAAASPGRPISHKPVATWRSIDQLTLVEFRPFPIQREFRLAKVNLVEGPNASGKTSLLEALELLVCGRTLRAADQIQEFRFRATINGKQVELKRLEDSKYRDKDAAWYSRSYRQGNLLASSFARFNFFDSDAAYRFSEDVGEGQVSKALKEIVFGNEAAQLEARIAAIQDRFGGAHRREKKVAADLHTQASQQREVVDLHRRQVASNVSVSLLRDRLRTIGFLPEAIDTSLSDVILKIGSVRYAVGALLTMTAPVGRYTLRDSLVWQKELVDLREEWSRCETRQSELERSLNATSRILDAASHRRAAIERLRSYLVSGAIDSFDSSEALGLRAAVARSRIVVNLLAALPLDGEPIASGVSLGDALKAVDVDLAVVSETSRETSSLLAAANLGQSEVERLVEDVRAAGRRIIVVRPDTSECPLCGSSHDPEELGRRINTSELRGFGEPIGSEQLRNRLTELQSQERALESKRAALLAVKRLASEMRVDAQMASRDEILREASQLKAELPVLEDKLVAIERRKEEILGAGYSPADFESQVAILGVNVEPRRESLSKALTKLEIDNVEDSERSRLRLILADIETTKNALGEFRSRADASGGVRLHSPDSSPSSSDLSATIESLRQALNSIDECASVIAIKSLDDLVKLAAALDECQRISTEIQASEGTSLKLKEAELRLKDVDARLKVSLSRVEQARIGEVVLRDLLEQSPLAKRLEFFFRSSGDAVRDTFLRIHSPREFRDVTLSDESIVLTRTNGAAATAKELSTGQRSALALSLFLTMHSMLKAGPHILLFDDPVVYVDDLNTLSFLDLIRELAMQGESQIFFATANSKISALMKAKCQPLAGQFQCITLDRAAIPPVSEDDVVH